MAKKWMQGMNLQKGALHKQLGIPAGSKIPLYKLRSASKKGGKLGRRARLALTFRKVNR